MAFCRFRYSYILWEIVLKEKTEKTYSSDTGRTEKGIA